jgi:hypothetical protein
VHDAIEKDSVTPQAPIVRLSHGTKDEIHGIKDPINFESSSQTLETRITSQPQGCDLCTFLPLIF